MRAVNAAAAVWTPPGRSGLGPDPHESGTGAVACCRLLSYLSMTRKSLRGIGLVVEAVTVWPQLAVPSYSK